jgi:hypothetical protein
VTGIAFMRHLVIISWVMLQVRPQFRFCYKTLATGMTRKTDCHFSNVMLDGHVILKIYFILAHLVAFFACHRFE